MEDTEGTIADREEVLRLLSAASRKGHVGSMRLLLSEFRRDGDAEAVAKAEAEAATVAKAEAMAPGIITELASKRKPPQ